ncbi:MAG: proton-conducting transporter membrane subunit [Anaerolineales bacterium]|nr:proton-conducting transporter membrane subunit [Anaerolineales bacterium]
MNEQILFLPILWPLAAASAAVFLRRSYRSQGRVAFLGLAAGLASSLALLARVWTSGDAVSLQLGGWPAPFGISLVGDLLSTSLVVLSQLVLLLGVLYAIGAKDRATRIPTFYPFFLLMSVGLTGAFLTGDLFNFFVFAELLVISGAALTALADDRYGVEAAYKYFYISLLATILLLLGIGSLYISYGTLNMADLAQRIAFDPGQPLLPVAIVLLAATFMVKSAVFPFHFWQPDFHTASPTAVSAMLSSVVVKLGVYGFLRMTTLLFVDQAGWIRGLLLILGVAGILYGGLAAIGTGNVKRMLAYSTIAQVGFILVAIGWGTPLALAAAVVFTFSHSLIKSGMLMLAGAVASRAAIKSAAFDVVTGAGKKAPLLGLLFFLGALALAGIPPTSGFISKLLFFQSGLDAQALALVGVIGAAGLLTLVYGLRAFQRIWWQPAVQEYEPKASGDAAIAPAVLILLVMVFGLWPGPILRLAEAISLSLASPAGYLFAVLGGS